MRRMRCGSQGRKGKSFVTDPASLRCKVGHYRKKIDGILSDAHGEKPAGAISEKVQDQKEHPIT